MVYLARVFLLYEHSGLILPRCGSLVNRARLSLLSRSGTWAPADTSGIKEKEIDEKGQRYDSENDEDRPEIEDRFFVFEVGGVRRTLRSGSGLRVI